MANVSLGKSSVHVWLTGGPLQREGLTPGSLPWDCRSESPKSRACRTMVFPSRRRCTSCVTTPLQVRVARRTSCLVNLITRRSERRRNNGGQGGSGPLNEVLRVVEWALPTSHLPPPPAPTCAELPLKTTHETTLRRCRLDSESAAFTRSDTMAAIRRPITYAPR